MTTPSYLASLIGTESGGNWAAQNNEIGAGGMPGHFGRVQFGRARLQDAMNAGAIPFGTTPEQFMASPELQMAAEKWHFSDLESQLAPYVGAVVNGKPLDMAALVAMGHLGGAAGARKYVETGGAYNPSDAYGTSLSDYATTHGGGSSVVASTKGGAPVNGLLGAPQEQDASGLIGLLTGKQKPWAGKLNDIGAVLLALSGSPAAQPLMEQISKRKDAAREDARVNKTAAWLASVGRDDLASAMMSGALSGEDAARIAMTPAEAPEPTKLQTFTGPDGKVYSFNPVTGEKVELTGAEAPEPGYQFMTPEEIAKTPGLDPNKAYQKGPDGKISEIGGGGVTVNTGDSGSAKFDEAFAKGDAETLKTISDAGIQATRNIGRIDQLSALLEANPTGAGAAMQQFAGKLGISTEGLDEIQAAQAVINSLVPEQRQPGSGPMSDADLALFRESLPQIMTQPGGNKIIVDTMRAIAQYDAEGAQIVQKVRDGTMTRAEAFNALQNRANPLSAFAGSAAPSSGDLAVGTVLQFDKNGNLVQ